jgi:hypothetical protein
MSSGERLGQIIPGSGAQPLDAARDARVAGDDDNDRVPVRLERGAHNIDSVDLRQVKVREDDVVPGALDGLESFVAGIHRRDVVALGAEGDQQALAERPVILDDQDPNAPLDLGRDCQRIGRGGSGYDVGELSGHVIESPVDSPSVAPLAALLLMSPPSVRRIEHRKKVVTD